MKENRITNYFKDSLKELRKVTWPTKNQAVKLTIIVLVFCVVFMVALGVTDYILNQLYELLLKSSM